MLGARKEMQKTILLVVSIAVAATAFGQTASSRGRTGAKQQPKSQTAAAQPAAAPVKPAADQGPPQPETALKWLQAKYRINGAVAWAVNGGDRYYQNPDLTFSRCAVEFSFDDLFPGNAQATHNKYTLSLQDLSSEIAVEQFMAIGGPFPATPEGEVWRMSLSTNNGDKKIQATWGSKEANTNTMVLYFNNGDVAKRAVAAFRDAIVACGGSKEAY